MQAQRVAPSQILQVLKALDKEKLLCVEGEIPACPKLSVHNYISRAAFDYCVDNLVDPHHRGSRCQGASKPKSAAADWKIPLSPAGLCCPWSLAGEHRGWLTAGGRGWGKGAPTNEGTRLLRIYSTSQQKTTPVSCRSLQCAEVHSTKPVVRSAL